MKPRSFSLAISDRLQDQSNYLRDSAANTQFELEQVVMQNPITALALTALISVSVGLAVGFTLAVTVPRRR